MHLFLKKVVVASSGHLKMMMRIAMVMMMIMLMMVMMMTTMTNFRIEVRTWLLTPYTPP